MSIQTLTNVSHIGLGEILRLQKLTVPPNQREYSWSEKEVTLRSNLLTRRIECAIFSSNRC